MESFIGEWQAALRVWQPLRERRVSSGFGDRGSGGVLRGSVIRLRSALGDRCFGDGEQARIVRTWVRWLGGGFKPPPLAGERRFRVLSVLPINFDPESDIDFHGPALAFWLFGGLVDVNRSTEFSG